MISAFATRDRQNPKAGRRAGFSLIEAAIVLGIMGVVLAAIWMTVGSVRENIRQDEANRQIAAIVDNIRSFYRGRAGIPTDALGNFDNLTDDLCRSGVIPVDMIRDRGAAKLRVDHPWARSEIGGASLLFGGLAVCNNVSAALCGASVGGYGGAGQFPSDGQAFRVQLRGVSSRGCIALAMKVTQQSNPRGLVGVIINGQVLTLPVTLTTAQTACAASSGLPYNAINFIFRLRQQ